MKIKMNNYQIIYNEKFQIIDKKNEQENLNILVNKSLLNVLNFIDNLFQTNSIQINNIQLSFKSDLDYKHFINKEIKTVFNLNETFIDKTNFFSYLYNLTIKEYAILIGFIDDETFKDIDNIKTSFKILNMAIKANSKNKDITFEDFCKSKKNINKIHIQHSKSDFEDFETEETTKKNNIKLTEKDKKAIDNYKSLTNENIEIFGENKLENNNNISNFNFNNKQKTNENKKINDEIEEFIGLNLNPNEEFLKKKKKRIDNENYEQKEMEIWLKESSKKLLKM